MKTLKYFAILLFLLFIVAACTSDTDSIPEEGTPVNVTLRLAVAGSGSVTRWLDENVPADDKTELMNNWIVFVADDSGNIVKVLTGTPSDTDEVDEEVDEIEETVTLTSGHTYTFYSFANLSFDELNEAVGNGCSLSASSTGLMPDLSSVSFAINGNGFDPSTSGIPMSNKQKVNITPSTTTVGLIVVRMLAKMELRFWNATASDITIKQVTLSEITPNADELTGEGEKKNIRLLPKYGTADTENSMAAGDLSPNIITQQKADYSPIIKATPVARNSYTEGTTDVKTATPVATIAFYLNESEVADATPGYFALTITTVTTGGTEEVQRYALLDNGGTDGWETIPRNDYRVVPIVFDDYGLDIMPYDFPPIGVYPASVKEEDGKFTCTFHAGGHFHIVPTVRRLSDKAELGYSDTAIEGADTWTFSSWSADDDATIYEVCPEGETAPTTDGSDNGYAPVWDATNHYIFGKLKHDDDVTGTAYHELKIHVNKGATAAYRTLTYKLYIIKE
ncbi:MAG: hypothetical protein IJX44_02825 [Bacteroidaceae bacterium]|nr:hypothetical protein [Bacteroidaceae bacterium]